ncbi:MAG TPA: DUF1508 domain-containing protein [Vicinamibacterales bacterium]|nr:DUF1508 domain-containing protein [Vicinamibacterales bacterium]
MEYQLYKDSAGQYRWRLVAANGKTIADSGEGYYNKSDCLAAINLVKSSANAPVKDLTQTAATRW